MIGTELGSKFCGRAVFQDSGFSHWLTPCMLRSAGRGELLTIALPSASPGTARSHEAEVDSERRILQRETVSRIEVRHTEIKMMDRAKGTHSFVTSGSLISLPGPP